MDITGRSKINRILKIMGEKVKFYLLPIFLLFFLVVPSLQLFAKDSEGSNEEKGPLYSAVSEIEKQGKTRPELQAEAAVLIDGKTGRILYDKNIRKRLPPASMTKLVTLYLIYDEIYRGQLDKNQQIIVPFEGSMDARPPRSSLMRLSPGDRVTLFELMQGTAIASGNDAAYALAYLSGRGDPKRFVNRMNRTAGSLHLNDLHFVDPDGWSNRDLVSPYHYALFAKKYIERFPYALDELHAVKTLTYPSERNVPGGDLSGRWVRTKKNTNLLLGLYPGIDGLKTGYIDESGFNFCATAKRGETRFIAVVMGIFTDKQKEGLILRAKECAMLLEYGFQNYRTEKLSGMASPRFPLKRGMEREIWGNAGLDEKNKPFFVTLSEKEKEELTPRWEIDPNLKAPIAKGEKIGEVSFVLYDNSEITLPIITDREFQKITIRERFRRIGEVFRR